MAVPRGSWTTIAYIDTEINSGMVDNETSRFTLFSGERSIVAQLESNGGGRVCLGHWWSAITKSGKSRYGLAVLMRGSLPRQGLITPYKPS